VKLTKSKLKAIINEEFGKTLKEDIGFQGLWDQLDELLLAIANSQDLNESAQSAEQAMELVAEIKNTL